MVTAQTKPRRVPKFNLPTDIDEPEIDRRAREGGPPNAGDGDFLKCKTTGTIYPWNEAMATRGDLVVAIKESDLPAHSRLSFSEDDPLKDLALLSQDPEQVLPNGPSRAA